MMTTAEQAHMNTITKMATAIAVERIKAGAKQTEQLLHDCMIAAFNRFEELCAEYSEGEKLHKLCSHMAPMLYKKARAA